MLFLSAPMAAYYFGIETSHLDFLVSLTGSPAISELFPGQYALWGREHVGEVIPSGRAAQLSLTCLGFSPSALPVGKHPELLGTDMPYSARHQALLTMAQALFFKSLLSSVLLGQTTGLHIYMSPVDSARETGAEVVVVSPRPAALHGFLSPQTRFALRAAIRMQ